MNYCGSLCFEDSVSFVKAMLAGVDSSGGRFVPDGLTPLPVAFFNNIAEMSSKDVAYVVVAALIGEDYSAEYLRALVDEWIADDIAISPAGDNLYAIEPFGGATMSQYDLTGRLYAILLRDLYDRQILSVESVLFSPSRDDSCAAIGKAFTDILGQSPVMLLSNEMLTDLEKRQINYCVPRDMVHVVACDAESLQRLCCKAMMGRSFFDGRDAVMISDYGVVSLVARVFVYFEMFRLLSSKEINEDIVVAPDYVNEVDVLALKSAVKLGLPVKIAARYNYTPSEDVIITESYSCGGYILCPRSAERWWSLHKVLEPGETGVFVQQSHAAKFRTLLEPLLNKVMVLPHRLYYDDIQHVKYKRVAPSLNAIKNCFTNY